MKTLKILIVIILLLAINGCSFLNKNSKENNITPTAVPTQGNNPTRTLTPTVLPTAVSTIKIIPTTVPSPTLPMEDTSNKPDNDDTISELIGQMSIEEKVGQLFFVRCNKDSAILDIETYHMGGFILFAGDFSGRTKNDVKEAINSYQSASAIPLLIGVDEEGGKVNRVSKYPSFRLKPFQSPQELYKLGGFDLIVQDTKEKAKLLKSLGINVNLAPVCDISTDPKDFIYERSFGKDAKMTSNYVKTVVETMKSRKLGSTLKHFPGYGNNVDTHTGIAIDNRSSKQFRTSDFLPFQAGIEAGADSILVSHNIVNCFDKKFPASLSVAVHDILREDLGYNGVIMTDDLSMNAITAYTGNQAAAVLAVNAGNDFIISSDYTIQIPAVLAAVKEGKIKESLINESVRRILTWKQSLGILENTNTD